MRATLLPLTLLALPLVACGGSDTATTQPVQALSGPRLTLASSQTTDLQDVSAEVATVDQAQVFARIPGILSSLSVRAGDIVHRGQVIGRVTDSQLGYQAGAYGAQAAAASAQANAAQAELERVRFLYQNGVYAKARLDQAEAAAKASAAQISAARAQQASVNAMAGQGALIAPANGRVLRADVPAGSPVSPGMAIAEITAGPVVLRLHMPETLAGKVAVGGRVLLTRPDGLAASGTIAKIYPDVQTGLLSADVNVPGLDSHFIGQRVAARVAAGIRTALLVPASYITTRYGLDYVTILGKDGSASAVPVQTAPAEGAVREILSGVSAGDTLIGVANPGHRP